MIDLRPAIAVVALVNGLAGCGPVFVPHEFDSFVASGDTGLQGDLVQVAVTGCVEERCATGELEAAAGLSTAIAELHDAGRPFSLSLSKSLSEPSWTYKIQVNLQDVEDPVDVHWEIHDTIADALVMRATFRNVLLTNRFDGIKLDVAPGGEPP